MRLNKSHQTSKLENVKKYYVIRNAQFNWDWSQNIRIKLVKLVPFYFAMLVETPMKVTN